MSTAEYVFLIAVICLCTAIIVDAIGEIEK